MPKDHIVLPENGSIVDISPDGKSITKQPYSMPTKLTVVDGNAVGTVQDVVLQDRKTLQNSGIVVILLLINPKTKTVKKSPDIISRGFVYLKESQPLINRARAIARRSAEKHMKRSRTINIETLKRNVNKEMQNFLYAETKKRPIIMSVMYMN